MRGRLHRAAAITTIAFAAAAVAAVHVQPRHMDVRVRAGGRRQQDHVRGRVPATHAAATHTTRAAIPEHDCVAEARAVEQVCTRPPALPLLALRPLRPPARPLLLPHRP